MSSTLTKTCLRQSGRIVKNESTDIKSSLRHTGKKNYVEQDDDNFSDYCPVPKKKPRTSIANTSERKLSLRSKDVSPKSNNSPSKLNPGNSMTVSPPPKRKYASRSKLFSSNTSDRKLRNQTLNESICCGGETESLEVKNDGDELSEVKMKRRSKGGRLRNSSCSNNSPGKLHSEHKTPSPKQKSQSATDMSNGRSSKTKPKVIDHFNQSEEINIESTASTLPKKSSEHKKNNVHSDSHTSRRRSTLSQKHTENNLLKFNGTGYVNHTNRSSISHHGKLCRKTKKTTILHDSNGWILSKNYWDASCEYWDWSNFDTSQKNAKTQQEIEIPSFREKKYTPLYKIEGTEDLSDHVFEKRHLQYEIMEKKIKKNFVMQSKYELQKSKYLKNNELLYKKESFLAKKFPKLIELNPDASDLKKIEIVPEVPVMAFGVPVKKMEAVEFQNSIPGVSE